MASRVAEVIYRLKDLFTKPAERVSSGYDRIRKSSRGAADSVERDNRRMVSSFRRLSGAVKGAATVFVASFAGRAIVGGITNVADELDRLGKVSRRLDIDPQTLAGLEFAADRSGIAISKMSASIETLQKRTGEALQGIGRAKLAFDSLGISAQEFAELNADEQLVQIANALQGVASEEERAAIAAQLFSKANADLLNLLNEGGPAIAAYLQEFSKFKQITTEQTDAAEAYNDAFTNLNAALDGRKFALITPVIETLNERLNASGKGANEIENVKEQLKRARETFDELAKAGLQGSSSFDYFSVRVVKLSQQLQELQDTEKAAKDATEQEAAQRKEQAAAIAEYKEEVSSLSDTFDEQAKSRKAVLDRETAELRAARNQQVSIEREFQNLVNEVNANQDQDVTGNDVLLKTRQAEAAAAKGETEEAIRLAREGGDLLKQLRDGGEEAGFVLSFLAQGLQRVATEASQSKVDAELIDTEQAQTALDGVKNKMTALATDAVASGTQVGKAFVQAMQQEISAAQLQLPAVQAPAETATRATRIIRNGNSFSDGTHYRELEKRGGK